MMRDNLRLEKECRKTRLKIVQDCVALEAVGASFTITRMVREANKWFGTASHKNNTSDR